MNDSAKFFFNRSFEILHSRTFDSYRLSLNNPVVIFDELNTVIQKYEKKKVKHFNPTVSEVGHEAFDLLNLEYTSDLVQFNPFTKEQIVKLLSDSCVSNVTDKKIRSLSLVSKSILEANTDFKNILTERIIKLVDEDDSSKYEELNILTSWLFSQLIFIGFSRTFIDSRIRKCGDSVFKQGTTFKDALRKFNTVFDNQEQKYRVVFKVKKQQSQKLEFASNHIKEIPKLLKVIEDSSLVGQKFKDKSVDEVFVQVDIDTRDFWSAVTNAFELLSQSVDINILHDSDNKILIENQAISIHDITKRFRVETIEQTIDGFYHHNESEFKRFLNNLKSIDSQTAKEKISSAIRFYKLGNESVEMDHKILNYWIGFEQLFSSVDSSEDSINRMKTFFSSLNLTFYFQRRVNYLLESLKRNNFKYDGKPITIDIFLQEFDKAKLSGSNPVLIDRLENYFKFNDNKQIAKYISLHEKRLNQHLTRIYRTRNELVHEGKTRMNTKLLAGHLRHYLLFTIEQVTHEISENPTIEKIDDAFVYYENIKERIKLCTGLNEIIALKSYKGYME